jgi:chromosome transmission fidelity protein 8
MTGECKKLGKPIAVVRKREKEDVQMGGVGEEGETAKDGKEEELEIVEVVRYKIVFSARPEPISGVAELE